LPSCSSALLGSGWTAGRALPPHEPGQTWDRPSFSGNGFIYGFDGPTLVGHHLLAEGVDQRRAEAAWSSRLARVFGGDRNGSG